MKTGNTDRATCPDVAHDAPQWSPVMKTGNTVIVDGNLFATVWPQWSPVMKTGNTHVQASYHFSDRGASMEPGHEDREYMCREGTSPPTKQPQWSPVMKTGNTWQASCR